MRHSTHLRSLAVVGLCATLLAPVASAQHSAKPTAAPVAATNEAAVRAPARCDPLPGEAPDQLPLLRSSVGLNYTSGMLESPADDSVEVCILVDSTGTVREVGISRPSASFDAAAFDAARWCVFAPAPDHTVARCRRVSR